MKHDYSTKKGMREAIISECQDQGLTLNTQIAYVIATALWETNHTLEPVREAYWFSDAWRKKYLRYYPYYGRGLVQLTWEKNYQKYSDILGVDLVKEPDIVLRPDVSLFILVHGFKNGSFTGKKLTRYINTDKTDFVSARRCINGKDKAKEIAKIAKKELRRLNAT